MDNRDDLDKYFNHIAKTLFQDNNEEFPKYFENSYLAGNRSVYQKNISETKKFDMEWITTVESYFPSIDKITREPKSFIRYDEDIVDIERAKKITSKSVRHLAANTQLIKEVHSDRTITPKKILTINPEQEYAIYENRFIATLINRLFLFVRNRYEVIKNNVESFQKDHLIADSKFSLNNTDISMKIDIEVKKDLDNKKINKHNYELLNRVEKLNQLISGLKNSKFMQLLKDAPAVHAPIMKTNIIAKNPEFKNAYNLWIFLDKYSILGYDVEVKEKNLKFDDEFLNYLNELFLINYTTIISNQNVRKNLYNIDEGYTEYTKKKTKVISSNPTDFVKNPDLIKIEDNSLNEYFLNKYHSLLEQSIKNYGKEEDEEETDDAIKKALRQTTEILNGLYESKFKLAEENDIFRKLVTKENLEKEYEIKKEQLRYAKIIREVKEVDYNDSVRQEKRLLRDLELINNKLIKQRIEERKYEENDRTLASLEKQIEDYKKKNDAFERSIISLSDKTKFNKDEKVILNDERTKALNKVNNIMKEYDAKIQAKFIEDKNKLLEELALEKEKMQELIQNEEELRRERKTKLMEFVASEKEKIKNTFQEYREKRKQEIANEKAEIAAMLDEYRAKQAIEANERKISDDEFEKNARNQIKLFNDNELFEYNNEVIKSDEELAKERALQEQHINELKAIEKARREKEEALRLEQERLEKIQKEKEEEIRTKKFEEERLEKERLEQERIQKEKETEQFIAMKALQLNKEQEAIKKVLDYEDKQSLLQEQKRKQKEIELAKKFELERLAIERAEQIRINKEVERQKILALNAIQREKENYAISKVQEYERTKNNLSA